MRKSALCIRKPKLSASTIILILLLFPFIQSRSYSEMPAFVGMGYRVCAIISSTIIYLNIIFKSKKHFETVKKSRLYIIFWICYIFSTVLFNIGTLAYVIYQAYIYFALVLIVGKEISKNPQKLLSALSFIYGVLISANFLLRFLLPEGLYDVVSTSYHDAYLLGDGNAVAYVALPGIIILAIYSNFVYGKIKPIVLIETVIALYTFYLDWSASAIVCGIIWAVFLVCVMRDIHLPIYAYLIGFILSVIVIVVAPNFSLTSDFIVNVLHKNVTFSGRTVIWAAALSMILVKPIFGYGGFFQMGQFTNGVSVRIYPCHTTYLQLLIDGGLLLFAIFMLIVIRAFGELRKNGNNRTMMLLASGIFCVMLHYVFEYSGLFHLFILLTIAQNSRVLVTPGRGR